MFKKILLVAGVALFGAVLYGIYLYNKPHSTVAALPAAHRIKAPELYAAFATNEAAASARFVDKVVLVSGKINDILATDTTLVIILESNSMEGGVSCNFPVRKNKAAPPSTGDSVTIKGRCTGYLADVMLTDCVVEE